MSAKRLTEKAFLTFRSFRKDIFNELNNVEQVEGIKWKRFSGLNKYLKGHRKGELTLLTGPTGSGKTTFLSEYSLDLCSQGVVTLWGNFEMKNVRLCKLMLNQFAQTSLTSQVDKIDEFADEFEKLPMYFMPYHGQESFDNVLKTMNLAVKEIGVEHIVLDNLQFMIGMRNGLTNLSRFEYQDYVIGACRQFATINNCHVTIVIHPRKEIGPELTINSFYGGGKAGQEADNILIFQVIWTNHFKNHKYLQICKNRFDGDLGLVSLNFNKESHGFGTINNKSS